MKNVAIFFGGVSVEHDVSIITGVLTLNTIDKERYNPIPVYIKDGHWYTGEELFDVENYKNLDLAKLKEVTLTAGTQVLYHKKKNGKLKEICAIAVAVNCMHGERGEDGSLSGCLRMLGIPLASPSVMASSIGMDKQATKIFLKGMGVKTLGGICTGEFEEGLKYAKKQGYPLMVKPYKLGSSIGVRKAHNEKELRSAFLNALKYGDKAVIEPLLSNFIEINCSAYCGIDGEIKVSECERPIGKDEVLTFEDKYSNGNREFPAKISKETSDKIKEITKKVYEQIACNGIIRIDYFVTETELILNEINTVPGSLAYYLFCDTLGEFKGILNSLIERAERDFAREQTFIKKFPSTILNISGVKSAKRL